MIPMVSVRTGMRIAVSCMAGIAKSAVCVPNGVSDVARNSAVPTMTPVSTVPAGV